MDPTNSPSKRSYMDSLTEIELSPQKDEESRRYKIRWMNAINDLDELEHPIVCYRIQNGVKPIHTSRLWMDQTLVNLKNRRSGKIDLAWLNDNPIKIAMKIYDQKQRNLDYDYDELLPCKPQMSEECQLNWRVSGEIKREVNKKAPQSVKDNITTSTKIKSEHPQEMVINLCDEFFPGEEVVDWRSTYNYTSNRTNGLDKPEGKAHQELQIKKEVIDNVGTHSVQEVQARTIKEEVVKEVEQVQKLLIKQEVIELSDDSTTELNPRDSQFLSSTGQNEESQSIPGNTTQAHQKAPDPFVHSIITSFSEQETALDLTCSRAGLEISVEGDNRNVSATTAPHPVKDPKVGTSDAFDLRQIITRNLRIAKEESIFSEGVKRKSEQNSLVDHDHKKQKLSVTNPTIKKQTFSKFHNPKLSDEIHYQEGASRACVICYSKIRNMKKHVILQHVTNDWWGVYGDSTCWKCQEFHTFSELGRCQGFFNPDKDTETFLYRSNCFEEFLKEDLQCETEEQLVRLINREGLAKKSISKFSNIEVKFMSILDRDKGHTPKLLYDASKPTRYCEILHWRTMVEIILYQNKFGVISGDKTPILNPVLIDSTSDLLSAYEHNNFTGSFSEYSSSCAETSTIKYVVCDIQKPSHLLDSRLNVILKDDSVKISVGMHPKYAYQYTDKYLDDLKEILKKPKVIAVGTVGMDRTLGSDSIPNQIVVLEKFLELARETEKPVKIYAKGEHSKVMKSLEKFLTNEHVIIYTNFELKYSEALEFLFQFPMGFIGISNRHLNPRNRSYEVAEKVAVSRLALASYSFFGGKDIISDSPDMEHLVVKIAAIKHKSFHDVSRQLRRNMNTIFKL